MIKTKKLTESEIDKMSLEELREYLGLGKPLPKSAWKHPELTGGQLVDFFRKSS